MSRVLCAGCRIIVSRYATSKSCSLLRSGGGCRRWFVLRSRFSPEREHPPTGNQSDPWLPRSPRTRSHRQCSNRWHHQSTQSLAALAAIPAHARVVIVGGGIIGNSVAYHLASEGIKDVVLLEQCALTAGTTWHAAGLMLTFGSLSETQTEFTKYTKQLYQNLELETGQSTGFKPVGLIEVAPNYDRLEEYRRVAAFNRKCGVDVHEISADEVKRLFPLCETRDVLAGFYVKDDGRVNPVDAAMALAKGAKMKGARIFEGVRVTGVTKEWLPSHVSKRVTGVVLADGREIKAEYVVNCAGMWARQFGELCGVNIPNQAAEHYYLITENMPDVDPSWPIIEDPSSYTYIRPEAGGLMVGLFEGMGAAWNVSGIPDNFSFGEIEPDWDRMGPYLERAMKRVPVTFQSGIKKFFCGPESFTPDGGPILGPAPELQNYFVAAGLNSIGILTGGGVGRLIAHWIAHGEPDLDVTEVHIDRFHKYQANPDYRAARVTESLSWVYQCHYPYKNFKTARNCKRSPFHDRLAAKGAYFADNSGWEGADWYAPTGTKPQISKHTFGRYDWFPYWEAEHRACREGVVVMDMSFMSKFLVQGRDAGSCLNRLCTADIDGRVGTITYTQWLNEAGRMEADVTVTKMTDDKFLVVATDAMHRRVEAFAKRHLDPSGTKHVFLSDVTSLYAQLNIQGPRSRELMQRLTSEDMSDTAYPFRTAREIAIGFARVTCARITYLGELGYELHIPTEHALHVYEQVIEAGKDLHLVHAGLKALASLRIEKGYRDFGHDVDNTDTLLEVGLGFTADFSKPGDFIGKECVIAQKSEMNETGGLRNRLCQLLVLDTQPLMYHGEVVYRDGKVVGDVRASSYGHTLGGAVGLAIITAEDNFFVNKSYINSGVWEVDIAGKKYPCKLSLTPLYDPKNKRIKS